MKRSFWFYAGLLALATAAGLAGPSTAGDSAVPSVLNPGPRGLMLLSRWLEQSGYDVRALHGAPPAELKTYVLAAPLGHAVSSDERAGLEAFVRGGGTLVYLRPRRSHAQPQLDQWLQLSAAPALPREATPRVDDLLGAEVRVTVRGGPLRAVKTLRVLADETVEVGHPAAVPVAPGGALWWWPLGEGEVFVGAGADLAEAGRLELSDNAAFWAALAARGPLGFDELHQAERQKPDLSANLVAVGLQLGVCALAFVLAFGARLGPARPTLARRHRSSLEYVESMGALARAAKLEPDLAAEVVARLARVLETKVGELPVRADQVRSPADYLALSRRCAELELEARRS